MTDMPFSLIDDELRCVRATGDVTDTALDRDHLYTKKIDDRYMLAIDSFSDSVEIIPDAIFDDVFVRDNRENEYYSYYAQLFSKDKEKIFEGYTEELSDAPKTTAVIICPSYRCNCRCVYCYQQKTIKEFSQLSSDGLERILEKATELYDSRDDNKFVGLFGGEPLLPENRRTVERVLSYCREKKIPMVITSNLVQMWDFADLIVQYRGYIARICTTLDGSKEIHNSRRISKINLDPFSDIVRNINFLLDAEINVTVSINLDRKSIGHLRGFLDVAEREGWSDNPKVRLEIGRVDDRLYEGCSKDTMNEAELLKELIRIDSEKPFPSNIKFAFLKTIERVARKMHCTFGQNEYGRRSFNYCWSGSPSDRIYYVDSDLNVFRCTYTVGKKQLSLGGMEVISADPVPHAESTFLFNDDRCWNCNIGGYCAGGCTNSRNIDRDRVCDEEKENFEYFVDEVLIPYLRHKLGTDGSI